ncbi:hypothetical protein [Zongyangia hominis]|nr:hypothetical protein [Zongyangia hominis]
MTGLAKSLLAASKAREVSSIHLVGLKSAFFFLAQEERTARP